MADTRGLAVNKDIYNFETMMYRVYDALPAKHKHTLSKLALQSTLDMRHYCNLACRAYKGNPHNKVELFSMALGYCDDLQDSLNHMYDMNFLSGQSKSALDVALADIRGQLSKITNSFCKQIEKGAEHREYASDGDPIF